MKTGWQDPLSGEIISPDIAGLQEAVGKIEDALDLKVVNATNVPLTEIYISENDRYRIYQAAGKRNWVSNPAPVIKVNGTPVSSGFTINYGGGAVVFEPSLTVADVVTADFSYVTNVSNRLDAHVAESAQKHITESGENANGRYVRFDDGTQICWYVGERTVSIDDVLITGMNLYCGVIVLNFPASFIDSPAASIGHTYHPNSGASWGAVRSSSANGIAMNYFCPVSCPSASMRVSYIAIGRWK